MCDIKTCGCCKFWDPAFAGGCVDDEDPNFAAECHNPKSPNRGDWMYPEDNCAEHVDMDD